MSKRTWIFIVIGILIVLFFLLRGCQPTPPDKVVTVITHDTTIVRHDSIVYRDKLVYTTIPAKLSEIPKKFIPSKNDDSLRKQYEELLAEHTNKHIYLDTLKIDSLGTVIVQDTVQFNKIMNRQYAYNIKERVITNTITTTITKQARPKNQLYLGIETGFSEEIFEDVQLGLMLKNKKDNIIGVGIGYDFQSKGPVFSLKYYTKLHL